MAIGHAPFSFLLDEGTRAESRIRSLFCIIIENIFFFYDECEENSVSLQPIMRPYAL